MKTLHIKTNLEMATVNQILKENDIKLVNKYHGLILVETGKTNEEVQNLIWDHAPGTEIFCLVKEV
jgi:hypothetical protein